MIVRQVCERKPGDASGYRVVIVFEDRDPANASLGVGDVLVIVNEGSGEFMYLVVKMDGVFACATEVVLVGLTPPTEGMRLRRRAGLRGVL